ncbi:glutathione synthetase-like [Haliotis rubra]|uniref:glutathione synthetase-like n=1 Tax=Haliotis rubra TaxID=36100 RepID=UPI001EE57742|nr:glutathione synthetase-like [Haliotis rubra]XP_046544104.1 glutathione synthetase-like [Haliotis rubra]XP_046544105.1 glutathione synthetase-like [Haliotis rubra]
MVDCLGSKFAVDKNRLHEVLDKARDFALSTGISLKSVQGEEGSVLAECAPFTLFPSVVPRTCFQEAVDCMLDFNTLIHKVAHDHNFLEKALKNVLQVDDFTQGLWKIYTQVREEGYTQPLSLGLFRNDFMLDVKDLDNVQPKQVEFNTISASFAGLTTSTVLMHRFTLDMIGKHYSAEEVPDNDPALGLAHGMVKAWELYGRKQAVLLFVVSAAERNIFDQRALEFKAYSINRGVRVLRRTYLDIYNNASLTEDKRMIIDGEEVAVVYLRTGYEPDAFPTHKEWDARLMLEHSLAIKCPSIQYQLAGTKKIQQELALPGSVEQFIKDPAAVKRIRATFVKQHSLDLGPEGDKGVELGKTDPDMYVLKPQREGGGNNLYGDDIREFLEAHQKSKERNAYILMERIFPKAQKNYLLKPGIPFVLSDVISELGIYGVYIGSATEEKMNTQCGHMLRTKVLGTDEGGICAGFAGLDTPFLVNTDHGASPAKYRKK